VLRHVRQLGRMIDTHVSKISVGLGLGLVFVRLFRFNTLCVFLLSLDYFVLMLFAFVLLG